MLRSELDVILEIGETDAPQEYFQILSRSSPRILGRVRGAQAK